MDEFQVDESTPLFFIVNEYETEMAKKTLTFIPSLCNLIYILYATHDIHVLFFISNTRLKNGKK